MEHLGGEGSVTGSSIVGSGGGGGGGGAVVSSGLGELEGRLAALSPVSSANDNSDDHHDEEEEAVAAPAGISGGGTARAAGGAGAIGTSGRIIPTSVPTFDLEESSVASAHSSTADETDLVGLFSSSSGGSRRAARSRAPAAAAGGAGGGGGGRIDPDSSGLRLDLDGLSGYEPYDQHSASSSSSKWDEARLTKSSSGGYPLQQQQQQQQQQQMQQQQSRPVIHDDSQTERSTGSDNLPDFVKRAASSSTTSTSIGAAKSAQSSDAGNNIFAAPTDRIGNLSSAGQSKQRQRRGRPRPWDDLNETSVQDDDDEDGYDDGAYEDYGMEEEDLGGGGGGRRYNINVSMQQQRRGANANINGDVNGNGNKNGSTAPPGTLQNQPGEHTPLLSNQKRRGGGGNGGNNGIGSNDNDGSTSWSNSGSGGGSMRFRNPLSRRSTANGSGHSGHSGTSSGHSGSGSGSGANYHTAASSAAAPSTANTDVTSNTTSTDRTFASSMFKWRAGGDLMPSRSRADGGGGDDDNESWTAGSVVREFFRPPWGRDGRSSSGSAAGTASPVAVNGSGFFPSLRPQLNKHSSFAYAVRPQSRAGFSFGLAILTTVHFVAMAIYDVYQLCASWSNETDGEAMWLSSSGLIANPLIGPPASTLTTFGATSGIRLLLSSEMWRVLTSLTLSTSVAQLVLHLVVLRFGTFAGFVPSLERRWSTHSTLALYAICALCGAVSSAALDYPADVTGLVAAGLCGLLSASLAENWLSSVREMRSDRLGSDFADGSRNQRGRVSGIAKILLRPGKAHLYIGLHFMTGLFAHASLWSMTGGLLSGLGCGLFHFSYLLDNHQNQQERRPITQTYGPSFSTPSKKRPMFGTPPHSPPETPPMRRSMIASPDANDPDHGMGYGAYSPSTVAGDASSPYRTPERDNRSNFVRAPSDGDPSSLGLGCCDVGSGVGATRFVGFVLALLVVIIPGTLVASGAVGEAWGGTLDESLLNESTYGCRSMRRLFEAELTSGYVDEYVTNNEQDDNAWESEGLWVCSQSCVPISLTARARLSSKQDGMGMQVGRCKEVGYRCQVGSGSISLESGRWWVPSALRISNTVYDLPAEVYRMADGDSTCGTDEYEDGDDAGAVADQDADGNEDEEGEKEEEEQEENQMQANAYGFTSEGVKKEMTNVAVDVLEEVVANAGV